MKKQKRAIVAFLLVAVLCLGIGFAALSDELHVDTLLNFNIDKSNEVFDEDVYFADAKVDTKPANCPDDVVITAVVVADDYGNNDANDKVLITVPAGAFTYKGETAVIKASIQNDAPEAVKVTVDTTATVINDGKASDAADADAVVTNTVFKVTCDVDDVTIAKESTSDYIVTITIELLDQVDIVNGQFVFTLNATTVSE